MPNYVAGYGERLAGSGPYLDEQVPARVPDPGVELAYAETLTSFSVANGAGTNVAGLIPALSCTVIGQGRPVDIRFSAPVYLTGTVPQYVQAFLRCNGLSNLNGFVHTALKTIHSISGAGGLLQADYTFRTAPLDAGKKYTWDVIMSCGGGGTLTVFASATTPIQLSVTSR